MIKLVEPVSPKAEAAIRSAIAQVLADFPVRNCKIEAKLDYNDDEAIFVEFDHELVDRPFDPLLEIELMNRVCEQLHALGEYRFPHLILHSPDGQKIKGW